MVRRVAVIDDYQDVARRHADWSALPAGAELTVFTSPLGGTAEVAAALRPFDVVVAMRERTPFPAALFKQLPELRLLVTTGMANASIAMDAARAHGVTVCGTHGSTAATPELTWGLILDLARNITAEHLGMREGGWQRTVGTDLAGSTLGLVGLGRIGTAMARIAKAFDMDVVAWSQNLDPARAAEAGVRAVSKHELFTTADFVSVHYKLSERSVGLVGAHELAQMKPTAYLVNTSRGPLVDQDALLEALRTGAIAGAGLDVYDVEPLPAHHPLRTAPHVVLTPHLGYVTRRTYDVFYSEAVENIAAFAAGAPVRVLG
ncbi:D-2-hydroxyacid dehydrogenase family protein [Peterkaempfera griseoplana]|uniref:D-2-hydroxyacid dehydrogenase family protein n=1 Tax=Peterkaempfera griseoplana TaxID=66896 RepID=UPI0006E137C2|nr:D-2-hydroxyacid dehydrogenase family protein [Peterkaempfera griseoplana]